MRRHATPPYIWPAIPSWFSSLTLQILATLQVSGMFVK
jgi:hypothetical protein